MSSETDVRSLCEAHSTLDRHALAVLAPIGASGHGAHLVLYVAEHAAEWRRGTSKPPTFVTRSRHMAMDWAVAERAVADPDMRATLVARRRAGEIATTHLVCLAEPLVRRVVRQVDLRSIVETTVVDRGDLLSIARAAVAHGVWAYWPDSGSGPDYLGA